MACSACFKGTNHLPEACTTDMMAEVALLIVSGQGAQFDQCLQLEDLFLTSIDMWHANGRWAPR